MRLLSLLLFFSVSTAFYLSTTSKNGQPRSSSLAGKLSEADKERLLLSEPALNAFIVAEMRHFVNETMTGFDKGLLYGRKWQMSTKDKIEIGILSKNGTIISKEYAEATEMDGDLAVELICNTTRVAFSDGFQQQGLLSALGSAIIYFRNYFREPHLIAACERIGMSDYDVAHHITDMYHHKSFRGTYTKTLTPSGVGEIAARIAVGLDKDDQESVPKKNNKVGSEIKQNPANDDDDECLVWSPTTPGVCLHWKSDEEAWRKKRFEKVQMEGTRDPRRGGSGTTR